MSADVYLPEGGLEPVADALQDDVPQVGDIPVWLQSKEALERRLNAQWREAQPWHYRTAEKGILAHRFYDGDQWSSDMKSWLSLNNRPPIVVPKIFRAINNVSGRQRESRLSWKVIPRNEGSVLTAAGVTKGAAYIEDATEFRFTESSAFKNAAIGPRSCVEIGYDESDPDREAIYAEEFDWNDLLTDPYGRKPDLSDYRYLIRRREVDEDQALAAWPQFADIIRGAAKEPISGDYEWMIGDYGQHDDGRLRAGTVNGVLPSDMRRRVRLREHHFWVHETADYIRMPDGEAVDWEPESEETWQAIQMGGQRMRGRMKRFYRATMADDHLLEVERQDLPFRRFSIVVLWAYVEAMTNRPYGLVEQLIWQQREINVNRSRTNEAQRSRRLLYNRGALGTSTEAQVSERLSQANFILEVNDINGVRLDDDRHDVAAWMALEQQASKDLDEAIGLNEAAYGDKGDEKSGAAIQRRVEQQGMTIAELWDNWRYFRLQCGRMMLALAIRYWPREKWERVISQRILTEHQSAIQKAMQMGLPMPPQADLSWVGSAALGISSLFRYDLKLEDQAETTTERQAAMQSATELMGLLNDIQKAAIAPDIIRMSDFEGKDEMAAKAEASMAPPPLAAPPPGMPPVDPGSGAALPPPPPLEGPPPGGPSVFNPFLPPPTA